MKRSVYLLLLFFVGPATLNASGFCWSKPGWLNDREQINLAVKEVILNPPNHNQLDYYFKEQMGEEAFYESFHASDQAFSSYEDLYSRYYDPRLWRGDPTLGYGRKGFNQQDEVIQGFLKENKNCCKFIKWKSKELFIASFPEIILGEMAEVIEVRYHAPFIKNESNKLTYLKSFKQNIIVSNCGRTTSSAF